MKWIFSNILEVNFEISNEQVQEDLNNIFDYKLQKILKNTQFLVTRSLYDSGFSSKTKIWEKEQRHFAMETQTGILVKGAKMSSARSISDFNTSECYKKSFYSTGVNQSVTYNTQNETDDPIEKYGGFFYKGKIPYIKSIGLSKAKSKHIIELSQKLISDFNGNVPHSREELMQLPGVGRKTANVVLNVIFAEPTMPVDTHLMRVCPKIGLAEGSTPEQIEKSLLERIPPQFLQHAHHWILLHGRYICTAKNPKCNECIINDICQEFRRKNQHEKQ